MRNHPRLLLAAVVVVALSTACSGGSSTVPQSATSGSASFSIVVPAPGAGAPAAMQSVEVVLMKVNGLAPASVIAPLTMNLTRTTPGCTPAAGGALSCIARIAVPPGKNTFAVTTFAQPNHLGAQVYSSIVTTTISAGHATTCVRTSPSPAAAAAPLI
jgi:hypothetical protein